ncbi:hypothetical protein BKA70DRAFT_1157564 [Coprinopsis sp. MPI-PUGE-AT-0042]|nr:hypothetical protein BKA70DRAFT_1157564 [Coprinopsis sp. MPI-PUGE-AT-0042]
MASEVATPPSSHNPREDVLSNEDLLDIIFGYIHGDNTPNGKPMHQLLHLALACKTFHEPALNTLWHTLPALFPLFKVLPSLTLVDQVYSLESVVTDDAWARMYSYGKRIRGVAIAPGGNSLSKFVYQLVALRGGRDRKGSATVLLPNLHDIVVECSASPVDYLGVFFLLGSPLKKVEVKRLSNQSQDVEFCRELLVGLYQNSTNLRELALEGTATPIVGQVLSQVGRLKALKSLSLKLANFPLSLAFLSVLGSLPELSSLAINAGTMNSSPALTDVGINSNSAHFPSLLKLEVIGAPSSISRILSRTLSPGLTHIHLIGAAEDQQTDPQHWKDCFYRIAEACKGLRSLKISPWNNASLTFDISVLTPVLDMGTIERLHLDIAVLTGSGVLDKIGKSCPNLSLLALPATNAGEDNPDLACLGFLAKNCPKLEDLSLCLRLNVTQTGADTKSTGHPLTRLCLSDAGNRTFGIPEGLPVAQFLDKLFPSLGKLEAYRDARGQGLGQVGSIDQISMLVNALKGAALRSK